MKFLSQSMQWRGQKPKTTFKENCLILAYNIKCLVSQLFVLWLNCKSWRKIIPKRKRQRLHGTHVSLFADLPLWSDIKSEWMWKKNLNTQKRIWIWLPKQHFYIEISTTFKAQKIWILSQFIWISLNFRKKIWMIQVKSEWMAGLYLRSN